MKQSFPPTHWERFGPGTIDVRASTGFNRSHPVNRSRPGTGKPGTICAAWWFIDRDGGDGGVGQSSDALMIRDPIDRPRRKGSFLAIFQYGGRQRGISPPTGRETGLPPEVTGYHPPTMQAMATGANRKPLQTLFWVRTVAKRGAHASRMDHSEEGPLLPQGWPSCDRQNGDRRKLSNGAGLGLFQRPMASNR